MNALKNTAEQLLGIWRQANQPARERGRDRRRRRPPAQIRT